MLAFVISQKFEHLQADINQQQLSKQYKLLTSIMCNAFSTLFAVSNENRASTSVDTLPGTIFKISLPNCTSRLSSVASTFPSSDDPCAFPYSRAESISLAYSAFFEAARIRDGFVVASCGLYLSIVAKSPESQTTVWNQICQIYQM